MSLQDSKEKDDLSDTPTQQHPATFIPPSARKAYDTDVTIEEYMYYAKLTRAEQKNELPNPDKAGGITEQFKAHVLRRPSATPAPEVGDVNGSGSSSPPNEKDAARRQSEIKTDGRAVITEDEWRNASRMMRTASCEYLFGFD